MRDHRHEELNPTFDMESLLGLMRVLATGLGLLTIVVGLVYVTRIFAMVYGALHSPDSFENVFARWVKAVGAGELDITIAGNTIHAAQVLAVAVMGGGTMMLCWITMGVILTGAKIVSWTAGDRAAVKKILVHAFGPGMKPAEQTEKEQT